MDPLAIILLVSGTVSLNKALKEKQSNFPVEKVVEKFLVKIRSKKIELLKGDKFMRMVVAIIEETGEYPHDEALLISEKVNSEVLDELEQFGNNINALGKRIDARFADILEHTDRHLTGKFLELKYELSRFVYLGKDQSIIISKFLESEDSINSVDLQKPEYGDFLEQCLVICNELGNYVLSQDEAQYESLVVLLDSFQKEQKQFEFLHELMNIFYRLSKKKPGSMVALSSVMDDTYKFNELDGLEFENAIIGFLNLLNEKSIELPTPFHHELKSFEIRYDLVERLNVK